jgi:predicted nucleic acid-binding protein
VIIPQQVYEELTTGNHPAVLAVKLVSWLEVRSINNHELIKKLKSFFFTQRRREL